ncbi:MAG TPA: type II secretion system protein GspK, partial [Gemmataceae bacterium]|nr:type II secretion system protein GspK [Gemmataceae bacterium]
GTDSYTRAAQARALAESGIDYAAAILSNPDTFANTLNSNPYSNPLFQGITVQEGRNPRLQGRFSIVAPLGPDDTPSDAQPYRFGVGDECGKINLNTLLKLDSSGQKAHDILLMLPNMTEDVANSILDWLDPDDDTRTNGAESDYYGGLNPGYRAKNGPLDSLEELLLVKGVTPQLLFGNDRNRNGILDPDEDDGSGIVDQGWAAYLTIYSRELNVDASGNPRIYVNDSDLNTLYENLSSAVGQDLANYIIAYRMYGPANSSPSNSGSSGSQNNPTSKTGSGSSPSSTSKQPTTSSNNTTKPGSSGGGGGSAQSNAGNSSSANKGGGSGGSSSSAPARLTRQNLGNMRQGQLQSISSLYALINSQVQIPSSTPGGQPTTYASPLNDPGSLRQYLPLLLDELTTSKGNELPARVNVNTAPQAVLAALPNLTDADVQAIVDHRPNPSDTDAPDPIFLTPAWLITEANFSPQKVQALDRYITARSQVYRVQSLGYFDGGGPTARIEAVIDTNAGRPRVVYWRDLTELRKGFNVQGSP